MELKLQEISYVRLVFYKIYIVGHSGLIYIVPKTDTIYSRIKSEQSFIKVNYKTWVNFHEIDMIDHTQVFMRNGKIFNFGQTYKTEAIEKYLKLLDKVN